jgi:SnoaL-like domain
MEGVAPPSRWLLIVAGAWTQLVGAAYLVLALASLPVAHDLHAGTHSLIASIVAALAALVCGALVYRGRLIPLALAAGLDVGFGVGLPRGSSAVGSILHVLPAADASTADTIVTVGAIAMFFAAILCVIALPQALKLRAWARGELARAPVPLPPETFRTGAEPPGRVPSGDYSPAASTLKGLGPNKLMPTQVITLPGDKRGKPIVIIGVAVSLIALGIVIITAATNGGDDSNGIGSGSAVATKLTTKPVDAAIVVVVTPTPDAPPEAPHADELVGRFHAALAQAKPDDLALLFDTHAFAFGIAANEVAEGKNAVVDVLRADIGKPPAAGFDVVARYTQIGHDGDIAWIAEELKLGGQTFAVTAAAHLADNAWTFAALHLAVAMPNEAAYRLGRDNQLPVGDAIPDTHDDSDLAKAMRQAFASKPSFVAARSTRPDGFNFGSAPGERMIGGDAIKKLFGHIKATMRLHDAVKVGAIGTTGGWGAANVEFTDADRDGTEVTQTFRVLAVWLREGTDWRIVQTQFSNAK